MQAESALLTLADWRAAYEGGASVAELIGQRVARLAQRTGDPAWILLLDAAALSARVQALDAAAALNERRTLFQRWPLFGVPFAIKDNIDAEGLPSTAACPAWSRTATASATAVRKLVDAGAVLIGKTNLDQFATGLVGTRSPYGRPASVFSAAHVSGGSSSGSAVTVARGDVVFALGTDTAGSGRVPAGFNNIVGLKPTPGRVSTAGVLPACRTLDCVSIFSLTVEDAAAVLAQIEGDDAADDYAATVVGPADWQRPLRIGIPAAVQLDAAQGLPEPWQAALQRAQALGAELVPLDFSPLHEVAALLYEGPWVAERHAVVQALLDQHPEAFDPTVAAVIARARGHDATATFRAQYRLRAAQRETARLWHEVDLLMVPTAPRHPSFADIEADPVGANAVLGTYTNFVNLLGWSALALPSGFNAQGMPFGVTFIGAGAMDAALARWGMRWQQAAALPLGGTDARRDPVPARWPATEATLPIAVVGAHLSGLPLNGQLTERGARLREATTTAPHYRLYALPGTVPPKPGLLRVAEGGSAIALEVWDMPLAQVGSFLALIPSPLGLGSVELADGRHVHGFMCEPFALAGAADVTAHGGWRAYLASKKG